MTSQPRIKPSRHPASGRGPAAPAYDPYRASARFLGALVWVVAVGLLFCAGQGVRYLAHHVQADDLDRETRRLYVSVLGEDIGQSPFGRLQFEQGKLTAQRRIGLDPLSVIEALGGPAMDSLRLESLTVDRRSATATGFFGPHEERFDDYLAALDENEKYEFRLTRREQALGGVSFSLSVELR